MTTNKQQHLKVSHYSCKAMSPCLIQSFALHHTSIPLLHLLNILGGRYQAEFHSDATL